MLCVRREMRLLVQVADVENPTDGVRTRGVAAELLRGPAVQVGAHADPRVLRGPEVEPAAVPGIEVVGQQPAHCRLCEEVLVGAVRHCKGRDTA